MPRIAWSRLAILVLGLSLASCFDDQKACPTCPPDDSASLFVQVDANGAVDSVQFAVDGGAPLKVRRGHRAGAEGLARGVHDVDIVRWVQTDGVSVAHGANFEIQLEQGEVRTIVFHKDFPLISWSPRWTKGPPGGMRGSGEAWALQDPA